MAIKYVCDRCGAEFAKEDKPASCQIWKDHTYTAGDAFDLCCACESGLRAYLAGGQADSLDGLLCDSPWGPEPLHDLIQAGKDGRLVVVPKDVKAIFLTREEAETAIPCIVPYRTETEEKRGEQWRD